MIQENGLSLDNTSCGKGVFVVLGCSRTCTYPGSVTTHNGNQPLNILQGPKTVNGGKYGTTRYPNISHGYGIPILVNNSRRGIGINRSLSNSTCNHSSLNNLKKQNSSNPLIVNEKVIDVITDHDTLKTAYSLLNLKECNFKELSAKLKTYILLGTPITGRFGEYDQIIVETIHLVLQAIFEPSFIGNSQGDRPKGGRGTALRLIKK